MEVVGESFESLGLLKSLHSSSLFPCPSGVGKHSSPRASGGFADLRGETREW